MTNIRSTILAGAGVAPLILGSAAGKAEVFNMKCFPGQSAPYSVSYDSDTGFSHITGSRTGFSRPYHAFDVTRIDNVLYVAVKAPRQTRVLYLAFGYARNGDDSSTIRVVDPAARSDKRDKCTLIPTNVQMPITPQVARPLVPEQSHRSVALQPEVRHITLVNNTAAYLAEVYVSAVNLNTWGENIVYNPGYSATGKPVAPGNSVDVVISDPSCHFDVRVVDSNHKGWTTRDVDVCSLDNTLTIN